MPNVADVIRDLGGPELIHRRCRAFWRGGAGMRMQTCDVLSTWRPNEP